MTLKIRPLVIASVLATLITSTAANGQAPLTGTRLKSAGAANPRTIIRFDQPDEIGQIESLLNDGKTDEALTLALQYVEQVDKAGMDTSTRYFAHNGLCVVYTTIREYAKAEEVCSFAVNIMPGYWSAWNNRGTARYLAGDMAGAQQDYLRALDEADGMPAVIDILRHNLILLDIPPVPFEP